MNNFTFKIQRFAQIYGTDGDDNIVNDSDNVTINALAGKDTVDNMGSTVAVYGGTGNDSLHSHGTGTGYYDRITNVTLDGGAGNDRIYNNDANYVLINGGEGNDYLHNDYIGSNATINGGAGDDTIYNSNFNNVMIDGGQGNDSIINWNSDNVTIDGGSGDDSIRNYGNNVLIYGGAGSNNISIGSSTSVTAYGGYGDDTISVYQSNKLYIHGGAGNDLISLVGSNADNINTIAGGYGNDTLTGGRGLHLYQYTSGDGNDIITDFKTNDTLQIGDGSGTYSKQTSGNDVIITVGNGSVTLTGAASLSTGNIIGPYNGIISGTSDADTIINSGNNVTVQALGGGDYIDNSGDYSFIDGGAGDDSIYSYDEDYSTINGGEGNDTIRGNYWHSSLNGDDGNDSINVLGGGYYNSINGGDGDDTISNNASYASIVGGAGDDAISNNASYASIVGGAGNDSISLGSYASNNLIQYTSGDGNDIVRGFNETSTLQIGNGTGTYSTEVSGSDLIVNVGDGSVTLKDAAILSTLNIAGIYVDPLLIIGTDYADTISNRLDNATIRALGGGDYIDNSGDNVFVSGGAGNDYIINGSSSGPYVHQSYTTILSGGGNDTVYNNGDYSFIDAGVGDDSIYSSDEDYSTINGGDGADTIQGNYWSSSLNGDDGNDLINVLGGGYYNSINGGDGDDTISNNASHASIVGGAGDDAISNNASYASIVGGAGDDAISNNASYASIVGGAGNDTISNNASYAYITAGAGNDSISLGSYASNNLIQYTSDDGNDVVHGFNETSTLQIGNGTDTYNSIKSGSDIIVTVGDGKVTLEGAGGLSALNISGTYVDPLLIIGTDYADTISNRLNNATILALGGNDTVYNNGDYSFIDGGAGDDSIYSYDEDYSTINGGDGADTIQGNYWSSSLNGDNGNDLINVLGGGYNNTINAGTGNDTIYNNNNGEYSLIDGGAGDDLITNTGTNTYITDGAGNDTIQNSGVAQINLTAGNDYVINSGQNTASTVQVDDDATGKKVINLSDVGDVVVVDEAAARNNSVNITGGAGNDSILVRSDVKTTIDMSKGGADLIATFGGANAKIILDNYDAATGAGIKVDELGASVVAEAIDNGTVVLNNGNVQINSTDGTSEFEIGQDATGGTIVNLIGAFGDNEALVGFTGKKGGAIDVSTFTNDAILVGNMDGKKTKGSTLTGGAGNDLIYVGKNDVVNAGAGNDTIFNNGSGKVLIQYTSGDGNDIIHGFNETSTLQISDGTGTYSKQTSGNDVIITVGDGKVTLEGATSLAKLNIAGIEILPGPKTLYLDDSDKSPVTLSSDYQHADASARVRKAIKIAGNELDNSIIGGDKNDSIYAADGDDTIIGGLGNDTFIGGNGNDLFVYIAGNDVVTDYVSGEDTIKFESAITNVSVKSSDVIFTTDDGKITVKNSGGKKINYIDVSGNASVYPDTTDTISVSLNSAKTAAEIFENYEENIFYAADYDTKIETIDASATTHDLEIFANETVASKIIGGDGNNILHGSTKNDTFTGGVGNDTFVYSGGNDTITDYTEDEDIIDIESGASYDKASVKGNDVIFTFGRNKITVKDSADKTITFSDGTTWDGGGGGPLTNSDPSPYILGAKIETVDGTKRTKAIEIFGNALNNSIVSGSKNDSIYGGDGDDTLDGAKGNDTLTGGDGYDLFIYSAGKDVITDYNEDEDIISLAAGTIKTASAEGSNVVFKIGSGSLTVNDAAGKTLSMIDYNGNEFSTVVGGGVDTLKVVTNDDPSFVTLAFEVEVVDATKRTKYDVTIEGNAQNNSIVGGSKNDSLYGAAGDDTLDGGKGTKGNDTLTGGDGNDVFVYTAGNDVITDYSDGDKISTGTIKNASAEGDDVVFKIGSGTLTVTDAAGKTLNMIDADGNEFSTVVGGGEETVSLNAAGTAVTIFEGYTADSFDAADYGSKLKTIDASATTHDFEIIGNGLANYIIGGSGDNILIGGEGNDKLWGNEGNDTFIYEDGDGKDIIYGFEDGDLLQITGDFSAKFNATKNEIAFKVGSTTNAITLKEFDATTFNINGDSYQISGTKLVKR